jgi:hypothetical protein
MYQAIVLALFIIAVVVGVSWKKKKPSSDQKLHQIKETIMGIDPKVSEFNFYLDSEASYILGDRDVHMCIHDEDGEYYDDNFLTYVALHEITHGLIAEDTRDHPPIFDRRFEDIKAKAIRLGIYNPNQPFPSVYCGKSINRYYD